MPQSAMELIKSSARPSADMPNIQAIELDRLLDNPANFFSMEEDSIAELAEDIRQNGLIHLPLVDALGDGRYMMLSGHRRKRAYEVLARENPEKYGTIQCQVRRNADTLTGELVMISANVQTRELLPAEKSRAATRMMELVERERAEGRLEFNGRTRDYVGEQLGMSGAQVAKLSAVERKLIPELKELFADRKITLDSAFDITSKSEEEQQLIYDALLNLRLPEAQRYTAEEVSDITSRIVRVEAEREEALRAREEAIAENERLRAERDAEIARLQEALEEAERRTVRGAEGVAGTAGEGAGDSGDRLGLFGGASGGASAEATAETAEAVREAREAQEEAERLRAELAQAQALQEAQTVLHRRELERLQRKVRRAMQPDVLDDVLLRLERVAKDLTAAVQGTKGDWAANRERLAELRGLVGDMARVVEEAMEGGGGRV